MKISKKQIIRGVAYIIFTVTFLLIMYYFKIPIKLVHPYEKIPWNHPVSILTCIGWATIIYWIFTLYDYVLSIILNNLELEDNEK